MNKVIFVKNINDAPLPKLPEDAVIVVHEMYQKPQIEGVRVMDWQKYKVVYSEIETSQLVFVGVNRMITPSNRCDMVNDYIQVLSRNTPKITIDTAPFIGEPWRLWFHYSVCFGEWMGMNYSYPVEGEWQKWFYYETNECRLSGENLPLFIRDTYSDLDSLTTAFEFYEPEANQIEWYDEAKNFVFEKYDTPKLLVNNLLKMSNQHFQSNIDFDTYLSNQKYLLPDLGVFRFVVEENNRRKSIYNCFTNEAIFKQGCIASNERANSYAV